jgi:hypothetical protein
VRVYLGVAPGDVEAFLADARIPAGVEARAVTAALVEGYPDGDEEELEYVAMLDASEDSLARLSPGDPPRRMVLVADAHGVDELEGTKVSVTADVPWKKVASLHRDTADAEGDVSAALAELTDPRSPSRERLEDRDLAWYAPQEIPGLL